MIPLRRYLLPVVAIAAVAAASLAPFGLGAPAAAAPAEAASPSRLTLVSLQDALDLSDQQSLQFKLATLQVPKARVSLDRARAASHAGGPTLAAALQQRYGVTLPADETGAAALVRGAELGVEHSALSLASARQSIRLAVTRAYVEWQKATALAEAQQVALVRAKAQLETAGAGLSAGSASKYDVLQAGAQVSAQQAALAGAEAGRESARLALERLVGASVNPGSRPQPALPSSDAATDLPEVSALTEKALSQRPEVAAARLAVTLKKADLDLLSQYLSEADPTLTTARLAVQEGALQLESVRADVRLQVGQAYLAAGSARERMSALAAGEAQAREALRLAQLRFTAGTATSVEVIGAQASLSAAEASHIQASADLAAALATLRQAAGDL